MATIGKFTIESLTIGMYSDPFTIYREYIQNAADAIDEALLQSILKKDEGEISINVNSSESIIEILDNGIGVPVKVAFQLLSDIGASQKDTKRSRGFRGIGRLGGIAYCGNLVFTTSYKGEPEKSIIEFDCSKIREMLQPGKYVEYNAEKVIEAATKFTKEKEEIDKHYFMVQLIGVDQQFSELLDEEDVAYYLSTVSPVPFDCQKFIYATQIKNYFLKKTKNIDEYRIVLNNSPKPILKKYRTHFKTGQQERTNQDDTINGVEYFEGYLDNADLLFLGWIGLCNFKGTVQDEYMRGIRIRKGNILIGDEQTFGQFFKSEKNRANGVFIGEVYVYWQDILPNARRDDFEKNTAYKELDKRLKKIADDLNRKYRRGYSQRNSLIRKYNESIEKIEQVKQEIESGITSDVHKTKLLDEIELAEKQVENTINDLNKLKVKLSEDDKKINDVDQIIKSRSKIKKEIIGIENQITDAEYKGKDELSFLSREQRQIYKIIIEIIDKELEKEIAKKLNDKIITALKHGGNKKK